MNEIEQYLEVALASQTLPFVDLLWNLVYRTAFVQNVLYTKPCTYIELQRNAFSKFKLFVYYLDPQKQWLFEDACKISKKMEFILYRKACSASKQNNLVNLRLYKSSLKAKYNSTNKNKITKEMQFQNLGCWLLCRLIETYLCMSNLRWNQGYF